MTDDLAHRLGALHLLVGELEARFDVHAAEARVVIAALQFSFDVPQHVAPLFDLDFVYLLRRRLCERTTERREGN